MDKQTAISNLIGLARAEVGVREDVNENNVGARIREYQAATWLKPGPWPWCSALCCWLLREWIKDPDVRGLLNKPVPDYAEIWRCKTAAAYGWEKWAKNHNIMMRTEKALAKAGDFVVYDFSHCGLVVDSQIYTSDLIKTVEGNTNGKGERDSESGDGVWIKSRAPNLVKSYIRILP